jgi:hypothetical protein
LERHGEKAAVRFGSYAAVNQSGSGGLHLIRRVPDACTPAGTSGVGMHQLSVVTESGCCSLRITQLPPIVFGERLLLHLAPAFGRFPSRFLSLSRFPPSSP